MAPSTLPKIRPLLPHAYRRVGLIGERDMVDRMGGVVVVVDDDEDWRDLVVQFLEEEGFAAVGAANGREALARCRAERVPPVLGVLDLEMPIMTGWEFRREQLRDPALARVPVIVTSSTDPGAILADGHLAKPYARGELLRAISALGVAAIAA
jgi:CheY-like chemotaxis protein